VEALRHAGAKKVVFIIFDGAGHGMFKGNSAIVLNAMFGFFDSTIGE